MSQQRAEVDPQQQQRHHLQLTDTPPDSPTSELVGLQIADSQPRTRSSRIHIDDNGVHDFDFKKRLERPASNKLKKLSRHNTRSLSSMSDVHIRSPSVDSETGSIKKRISSLLGTSTLHKSNSGKSNDSKVEFILEPEEDPLPDTKKELEVRLNHHLVELDMLKKTVQAANDVIYQHGERYEIMQARTTPDMKMFMRRQKQMVKQARYNRDSYITFVWFHLQQLERIKLKRVEIETEAGLVPTLPQVYQSMWTEQDWQQLFQV